MGLLSCVFVAGVVVRCNVGWRSLLHGIERSFFFHVSALHRMASALELNVFPRLDRRGVNVRSCDVVFLYLPLSGQQEKVLVGLSSEEDCITSYEISLYAGRLGVPCGLAELGSG